MFSAYFYDIKILRVHKLNTKQNIEHKKRNKTIVLLKTNNLSLCLNREYIKCVLQKNILK